MEKIGNKISKLLSISGLLFTIYLIANHWNKNIILNIILVLFLFSDFKYISKYFELEIGFLKINGKKK